MFLPKNKGFTLIELVVVIVILGILAATALPKFVNLGSEARTAAVKGLAGAMHTAANTLKAKCMVASNPTRIAHATTMYANSWLVSFTSGGITYNTLNCYPDAGWIYTGDVLYGYIETLVDYDKELFEVSAPSMQISRFQMKTASQPETCYAQYQQTTDFEIPPTVSTVISGC